MFLLFNGIVVTFSDKAGKIYSTNETAAASATLFRGVIRALTYTIRLVHASDEAKVKRSEVTYFHFHRGHVAFTSFCTQGRDHRVQIGRCHWMT